MNKSELRKIISEMVKEEMYKVLPNLIRESIQKSLSPERRVAIDRRQPIAESTERKFTGDSLKKLLGYGDIDIPDSSSKVSEMVITPEYPHMEPISVSTTPSYVAEALTRNYGPLMEALKRKSK